MPELVFKGKEYVYNHHLTVAYRPLVPDAGKSIGPADLAGNVIIHGDNLHALKSLLPRYAGKVDLVFIDPPYNTGNENWSYNDNVNSPIMQEWLRSNPVNAEDMLRHDKWLCMMWPRLVLLRELLSERGSLWMTLDDNEMHRARCALDEIFGEGAFVASIVWQKKYTVANDHTGIAPMHDHLLVYRREDWGRNKLERENSKDKQYRYHDTRGVFRLSDYTCNKTADERPRLYYAIRHPKTGKEIFPSRTRVWAYSKEEHEKHVEQDLVWWGKDCEAEWPYFKRYRHMLKDGGQIVPGTWWSHDFASHTDAAKKELLEILPELPDKDKSLTVKPVKLIERIIQIGANKDSLILDSFAGSGTTAHAVLRANAKDGGSRRFILVESEDYADRITAERVRRVINGYAFSGTQREELLREKVTWTQLQKAERLLARVEEIRKREGFDEKPDLASQDPETRRFDRIAVKVEDGVLLVEGEKKISERVEGLGGEFTFCTLGEPLEAEKFLSGEVLPDYESLGAWLFHTATGGTLDPRRVRAKEFYLGEAENRHLWLIYRPDLRFLKSPEAALTLSFARSLQDRTKGKKHLVFAAAKFLSNRQLLDLGVEFAPLPFALYREA